MTSSDRKLDRFEDGNLQNKQPQFNQEMNLFGSLSKLENDIEYSLDNNLQGDGYSQSSSFYGNADPQPLIRKNRIDSRYDALPPEMRQNDAIMKSNGNQEYLQEQEDAGNYGNENYGNTPQKSDFGDTYGHETYYENPTAVLKPSPNDRDTNIYGYGIRGRKLDMVKGRYNNMGAYEGWKEYDNDDAKAYYDLNYLLRKIMG